MASDQPTSAPAITSVAKRSSWTLPVAGILACIVGAAATWYFAGRPGGFSMEDPGAARPPQPRMPINDGGFSLAYLELLKPWQDATSLVEIRDAFHRLGYRNLHVVNERLDEPGMSGEERIAALLTRAQIYLFE